MPNETNMNAYVKNGRLFIFGVVDTSFGVIPFGHNTKLQGDVPEGPVCFGAEDTHPALVKAIVASEGPINHAVKAEEMRLAAQNLVLRSRQGEQNATAIICLVRDNARKGIQQAKVAYKMLMDFIKSNPPTLFGADLSANSGLRLLYETSIDKSKGMAYGAKLAAIIPTTSTNIGDSFRSAVTIANGKELDAATLNGIRGAFRGTNLVAFEYGYKNSQNDQAIRAQSTKYNRDANKALQIGFIIGYAKKLQNVRKPGAMIAGFDQDAAYEVGEGLALKKAVNIKGQAIPSFGEDYVFGASNYYDEGGSRPEIPPEIKAQNISKAGIAPSGYKLYTNPSPPQWLQDKCKTLVFSDKPFGYEEYAVVNGTSFFFRIEPHYHPATYAGGPHGWHKGATSYVKIALKTEVKRRNEAGESMSMVAVAPTSDEFKLEGIG